MTVAHTDCSSFPQPSQPVNFTPFSGGHSVGHRRAFNYRAPGYSGPGPVHPYDPRLYASPPQGPPGGTPPSSGGAGAGGGGNGNGGGNGTGNGQHP